MLVLQIDSDNESGHEELIKNIKLLDKKNKKEKRFVISCFEEKGKRHKMKNLWGRNAFLTVVNAFYRTCQCQIHNQLQFFFIRYRGPLRSESSQQVSEFNLKSEGLYKLLKSIYS